MLGLHAELAAVRNSFIDAVAAGTGGYYIHIIIFDKQLCYIVFDAKNTANLFPIGQLIVLIVDNPHFAAPPRVDAHYCFVPS